MSLENQNPNPEMFVIPSTSTEATERARIDAQAFANEVNATKYQIEVTDKPSSAENIEVHNLASEEMRHHIGMAALENTSSTKEVEQEADESTSYLESRLGKTPVSPEDDAANRREHVYFPEEIEEEEEA